jgi:DNA-directed RNA polymerase subunit alpha
MTTQISEDELSTDLLFNDQLTADEIRSLSDHVRADEEFRSEVDDVYDEFEQHHEEFSSDNRAIVRKATLGWILGNSLEAVELLDGVQPSRESNVVLALAHKELGNYHEALELFEEAYETVKEQDGPRGYLLSDLVECYLQLNQLSEAHDLVEEEKGEFEDDPNIPYLQGFINELEGRPQDALEKYQEALELDENHIPTLFRKAILIDRQADQLVDADQEPEEYAQSIYEKIMDLSPSYEGPVMNLGVLYEDQEEYEDAQECYQMVLNEQPNDEIAEMYYGDAEASMNLSFREERMRQRLEVGRILNKALSEFDFPQRIMDAFDQLNAETLGDLIQCSEDQLLACNNFGQYSLDRVKDFLDEHDLSLSQSNRNKVTLKPGPPPEEVDDILRKQIEDFDWSARSKRAMKRLSIYNLKDLVEHTEEELLDCQNFGETSLQEVKDTLSELGLSLKDSED